VATSSTVQRSTKTIHGLLVAVLLFLLAMGPIGCLARSAGRGDVDAVREYLAEGDSPNSKDWKGRSALELAIILNRKSVIDLLIEKDVDLNRRGKDTRTPLIWASMRFGSPDLIHQLVEAGADPNGTDRSGQTALLHSVLYGSPGQTQALIDAGADPNKVMTPKWKTPVLDVAIRHRKPAAVQILVAGGADVEPTGRRRKSARVLAGRDANLLYSIDRGLEEYHARNSGRVNYAAVAPTRPAPAPRRPAPPQQPRRFAPRASDSASVAPQRASILNSVPRRGAGADLRSGAYPALVIGNDDYQHLPKLQTAVNDATAIGEVLQNQYGYNVKTLYNASRSDILQSLSYYRKVLTAEDNLVIYYAGHGWLDEEEDRGFWLPVDATQDDDVHWIPNSSITSKTRAIEAKHIMVIADSCYSGKLVRGIHVNTPTPGYLKKLATRRARVVLTSGGIEPVSDSGGRDNHSVFASALLEALRNNEGVLEGHELFTQIRRPVAVNSDQIPEYSDIRKAGHDGGDFLFITR
jgi:hypothetical protein